MKVTVVLTSPEQHPISQMPDALWSVWYFNRKLLDLIEATGCPNTGCQHTLTVKGLGKDVVSWLDLFLEHYPTTLPEISAIKETIKKGIEERPDIKHLRVVLSQLTRDHDQNGININAPWFYRD